MIDIKFNKSAMKQLEKALSDTPKEIGKRTERAINKAASKHKTQIAKKLREFVKVKAAVAKDSITIPRKALAPSRLSTTIKINQTKKIGLNRFGAKQNKKGVRYQVSNTEKGFIESGFIVDRLGGHVFKRKNPYIPNPNRDPSIRSQNRQITAPLRGTTMYNVYTKHKLGKWSNKTIAKELRFQIEQQVKYVLEKKAKIK
jgi:hypothetical protein